MTVFGEIKYAFVARSMAARGAGLFGSAATTAWRQLRLQQLGVAHGEPTAEPVFVRFVWILIRDIRLRQAIAHSGVHIIAPWEEIVQRFMESYEAVLPQMERSTCTGPVEFCARRGMV